MSDPVDFANDYAAEELENRIKSVREKSKYKVEKNFVFTECLNCYEPSSERFCCIDCRDDYDHRKSRE